MIKITALLIILSGSLRRSGDEKIVLYFSIPMIFSVFFCDALDGAFYFLSNAALSYCAIYTISYMDCDLSRRLQSLLFVSIGFNLIGYVNYFFYQPPFVYVWLFRMWFILALYAMLKGGRIWKSYLSCLACLRSSQSSHVHGHG